MFTRAVITLLVPVIFVTDVVPWTIDLPEVRRFYFEKYSKFDDHVPKLDENQTFFDNINGDSLYNTDRGPQDEINYNKLKEKHFYETKEEYDTKDNVYAKAYNHGEYMDFPPNITSPLSIGNFTGWRDFQQSCRRATEASEHVRRLVDLALWATRRLQDVAYTAKYSKDASMEENELLLRLAWYLDKLAHLTGYEPNPERYIPVKTNRIPPPTPQLANPLNITDEMKQDLLKCLKEDSKVPATERCAFPNPPSLAEIMAALSSAGQSSSTPTAVSPSKSSNIPPKSSDDTSRPALKSEILEATSTDNRDFLPPTWTFHKSVNKRSVSDETNPLVKVMKYYVKQKVWEYSNLKKPNGLLKESENFDVKNDLQTKHIQKREVFIKNNEIHVPPPLHKVKAVVHNVAEKIKTVKSALVKAYAKKILPPVPTHVKHFEAFIPNHEHFPKHFRRRRNVYKPHTYYRDVIKPIVPLNPQMDISYYVKNKEGTNFNADLVQAALLRASLEAIFQRGNIAVIHRYGSNYNPAVPAPFYAGILRTVSDV
ncbi:unnamed protein product [Diatraea saccharalis]|uniref:Uncharacterized protein n=1 Tax=Diatraea saccharalis TaxID=40085 RepID=A0A9N9R5Y4_9NEOP|nr:unnamed protein product [Diatraea saccharalis]